jgi:3-isopropylmalate/(R)-2-methylmalate dehydratase small subunit
MSIKGKVWKYGDDVNTDVIFPGKYTYTITDPKEMALHALEDLDPEFTKEVRKEDIIIAGRNFGCGSSREQAATCLKYAGVGAIVAKSFSRIFFRNAINQGLPLVQCKEAVENVSSGEIVTIDFEKGELSCKKDIFKFPPLPESVLGILEDRGLIPHTKKILKIEKGE